MASIAGSSKNMPKKRKLQEENISFNDEWLLDYFVTPNTTLKGSGSICLICKESISVNKEYNVKRHYESKHSDYNTKNPARSTERQKRVDFLKSELSRQQTIFSKAHTVQKKAYVASLKVAWTLWYIRSRFRTLMLLRNVSLKLRLLCSVTIRNCMIYSSCGIQCSFS